MTPSDKADLKIYCDTNTLRHNIRDDPEELEALDQLQKKCSMFGSHLAHYEAMKTSDQTLREALIIDYNALEKVSKDIRVLGFNTVYDQYGGFVGSPLISDVQDETLRDDLIKRGLEPRDAEHITQAVCNDCDVFLTLDVKTIIKPHGQWLEQRFSQLKVWRPSELLKSVGATAGP
jgi:hypothetical protein